MDTKFLIEMVKTPDLPNAPMTRWVMYLLLFDFEINHVPAEKHQAPDGLSCRKRSAEDSEDEDAEGYLDKFIGCTSFSNTENFPLVSLSTQYSLPLALSTSFMTKLLYSLMGSLCAIPETLFGEYDSPTSMSTMCGLTLDKDDDLHDDLVACIRKYNGFSFDPAFHDTEKPEGSLIAHSLLKSTDSMTYTGQYFTVPHLIRTDSAQTPSWPRIPSGV